MTSDRQTQHSDTICGLATGAKSGGVGIIRISGPETKKVLERCLRNPVQGLKPFRLQFVSFINRSGHEVDTGYAVYMPGPKTYTAEDVAELQGHGGSVNLKRLLNVVLAAGARLAQRGEFTLRAFLNGRIDLSQAEAVLDIVQARTETGLDVAHAQLRGGLSDQVRQIRDQLVDTLARLEAQIDFVEEDLPEVHGERPLQALDSALSALRTLIESYERGRLLRQGARVVLLGPPNAGKSSLFNALLRQSRAIVTEIPGTTRDFLEEEINLGGIPITLIDTAGIRPDSTDPVETAGMNRSMDLATHADLVLVLNESTSTARYTPPTDRVQANRQMHITTKSDLATGDVSTHTGEGIDRLASQLTERFLTGGSRELDQILVTSVRHHEALETALIAVNQARRTCVEAGAPELIAVDIQEALSQLGLIVGETTTDDLLDRIFSEFCIGK